MNKTLKIWIIVLAVIAFCGALFCTIWYTVPVDVNSKLDKFLSKADVFYFWNKGRKYSITSEELKSIFNDELKDVKFINSSGIEYADVLGEFLFINYQSVKFTLPRGIEFKGEKVFIDYMVYISDREDLDSIILKKVKEKAVNITPPPPPGYEDALE